MSNRNLPWVSSFYVIILLNIFSMSAYAYIPPWISVSVDGGYTSNLFLDSLEISDKYGILNLDIEQTIYNNISAYYNGNLVQYSDNSDLNNFFNSAGIYYSTKYRNFDNLWLSFSGLNQGYSDYYSIYNRNKFMLSSGGQLRKADNLRIRSALDLSRTNYPSYTDSLNVNFYEINGYVGFNFSFNSPISLDVENGIQYRRYNKLVPVTSTSLYYLDIRISSSINPYTGVKTLLTFRNQLLSNDEELYALYNNGIDTSNLLWQGWRMETGIKRIIHQWIVGFDVSFKNADYMETSLITGLPDRNDKQWMLFLSAKTSFSLANDRLTLWFYIDYDYENNNSNDTYFDYDSHDIQLGITLENY